MDVEESEDKLLNRAADILNREMRNIERISINPLDPADITIDIVDSIVPTKLKQFLGQIFLANYKEEKKKKVLSIAQDIVSLNSNGREKMPKHLDLRYL